MGAKPITRKPEETTQRDNKVAVSPSRPMICSAARYIFTRSFQKTKYAAILAEQRN